MLRKVAVTPPGDRQTIGFQWAANILREAGYGSAGWDAVAAMPCGMPGPQNTRRTHRAAGIPCRYNTDSTGGARMTDKYDQAAADAAAQDDQVKIGARFLELEAALMNSEQLLADTATGTTDRRLPVQRLRETPTLRV